MMMTINDALIQARSSLALISDVPHLEAELLLLNALNVSRSYLHAWPETILDDDSSHRFWTAIKRRCGKEPLPYIIGKRAFWTIELEVTPSTLIPRPETELLVEYGLKLMAADKSQPKVLELGTGSGAIALALAHERLNWRILATDKSQDALNIAQKNAWDLQLGNIHFVQGHWFDKVPLQSFDLIVSNPPYIAESEWLDYANDLQYEPKMALLAGPEGLDAISEIIEKAYDYLAPGAYLVLEHGFLQGQKVRELFNRMRYQQIQTVCDMARLERITFGCKTDSDIY
jgi:release factor glutamine methyltransferase